VLLNAALEHDPSLEPFRPVCQSVTDFYLVERYPSTTETGIAECDVRNLLTEAEALIEKLQAAMNRL
jgi:hypothetical protein